MDYFKLTAEELRSKEVGELRSASHEVRKSLAQVRMDVYTASAVNTGKVKKLKKALARILTVSHEKARAKV